MSPVVDGKHYGYGPKGVKAAKAAAKKTGMPMKITKPMPMKGMVKKK